MIYIVFPGSVPDMFITKVHKEKLEEIIQLGLDSMAFPGCQLLVAKEGKVTATVQGDPATYAITKMVDSLDNEITGDAIFVSGDGGDTLGRYRQLEALTKVIYSMAQDVPESAGAVWSRRLGILQNAHAKRLRDAELLQFEHDDDDEVGCAIQ